MPREYTYTHMQLAVSIDGGESWSGDAAPFRAFAPDALVLSGVQPAARRLV